MKKRNKKIVMTMLILIGLFLLVVVQGIAKQRLRVLSDGWIINKFQVHKLCDNFEKEHPGVNVILETKTEAKTADMLLLGWLVTQRTENDLILSGWGSQITPLVAKNMLEPWDDFFVGDFKKSEFIPAFLKEGEFKGKIYAIPFMGELWGIVVNMDMFREAGLVGDKGMPITARSYDELYEYAKKLTVDKDGDGKPEIYGLEQNWYSYGLEKLFPSALRGMRGSAYSEDRVSYAYGSPEALKFLTFAQKVILDGYASAGSIVDGNSSRNNFKKGTRAMIETACSRCNECREILGEDSVSLMATPGALENGSVVYSILAWVPKIASTQGKKLTKQFCKEQLLSKEISQWSANHYGKLPVLKRNYEGFTDPLYDFQLNIAKKSMVLPKYIDYNPFRQLLFVEISELLLGRSTPAKTLADIPKRIKELGLKLTLLK